MSKQLLDPELFKKSQALSGMPKALPKQSYIKVGYQGDERGHFLLKRWNEMTEEYEVDDLGTEFSAPIIAVTMRATAFDPVAKGPLYETREYFDHADTLDLISHGQVIVTGTYKELKAKVGPVLKFNQVLYILYTNPDLLNEKPQIVKWFIKGASLAPFWQYRDWLGDHHRTFHTQETVFYLTEGSSPMGTFFVTNMKAGEDSDVARNVALAEEVQKGILAMNENFRQSYQQYQAPTESGDIEITDLSS